MAASVYSVARNLYAYACGNAARIAEIQTAFDASMSGGALTKGGLDAVTSATKNRDSVSAEERGDAETTPSLRTA